MKEGLLLILSYAIAQSSQSSSMQHEHRPQPVMQALYVDKTPLLDFGTIEGSAGGTIRVTTTNHRHVEPSVTISESLPYARAKLKVRGKPGERYSISLPAHLLFSSNNNAYIDKTSELKVTNLTSYSVTAGEEGKYGKIDLNGEDTLYVGGTLHVSKNVLPGNYSGVVPIAVSY